MSAVRGHASPAPDRGLPDGGGAQGAPDTASGSREGEGPWGSVRGDQEVSRARGTSLPGRPETGGETDERAALSWGGVRPPPGRAS